MARGQVSNDTGLCMSGISAATMRSVGSFRPPQCEIELLEFRKNILVNPRMARRGFDNAISGRESRLGLLRRLERSGCEKGENRRTQAGRILIGNKNRLVQHIGIDPVEGLIALGNAAAMNAARDGR